MGTLLKYEFCRSRTIFLGIIGVTLLIELVLSDRILYKDKGALCRWPDRRHSLSGTGRSCNSAVRRYHV